MIIRVVKMHFHPEHLDRFKSFFEERKERIRGVEGCLYLRLLQDKDQPSYLFTYSHWKSEADLERYRHSDFFKDTWQYTKSLFAGKAEAWSLEILETLE